MKIKIKRRRSRKVDQPNFNQVRFITFIGPFPELFDYTCSSITWPKCTQEDRKWNCCDKHHSSVQLHRASQHHYLFSVIQCNSAILLPPPHYSCVYALFVYFSSFHQFTVSWATVTTSIAGNANIKLFSLNFYDNTLQLLAFTTYMTVNTDWAQLEISVIICTYSLLAVVKCVPGLNRSETIHTCFSLKSLFPLMLGHLESVSHTDISQRLSIIPLLYL